MDLQPSGQFLLCASRPRPRDLRSQPGRSCAALRARAGRGGPARTVRAARRRSSNARATGCRARRQRAACGESASAFPRRSARDRSGRGLAARDASAPRRLRDHRILQRGSRKRADGAWLCAGGICRRAIGHGLRRCPDRRRTHGRAVRSWRNRHRGGGLGRRPARRGAARYRSERQHSATAPADHPSGCPRTTGFGSPAMRSRDRARP